MSSQASTNNRTGAGRSTGNRAGIPWAWRTSWRLGICAAAGVVAGALAAILGGADFALSAGWDVAAAAYCLWVWLSIWPMDATATATRARTEDPNRAVSDVIALSACVASIAAVVVALVGSKSAHGAQAVMLAALGLVTVAVSWFTVHTIFLLRYALLYYSEPEGGVDFHCDEAPCYRDFAYIGLTVGATFQVSDTDLLTTTFRASALRHTLLSYLFGAIILGVTVNMIASL